MVVTRLTFEERRIIEEMLRSKSSCRAIAIFLGRAYSAITSEIRYGGGREHYSAEQGQKVREINHAKKIAILRRTFTESEVIFIKKSLAEGSSISEISESMKCNYRKVKDWVRRHTLRSLPEKYICYEERISNLEMQMEILIQHIEGLNGSKHK